MNVTFGDLPHTAPQHWELPPVAPMRLPPLPQQPLVSVIMSNYNYAQFLPESVESVLCQTYPRFELIICDDGSTDNSRSVIESLASSDPRIHAIFKPNGGQASAWNHAYKRARGEIICFLDSDDIYHQTKLERVVETFIRNPAAGMVYHRMRRMSSRGQPFGVTFPRDIEVGWLAPAALERGFWANWPQTVGVCMRRAAANRLFPLPLYLQGFGDAFIQGAACFLTEIAAAPDPRAYYRMHGANDSGSAIPTVASVSRVLEAIEVAFRAIRAYLFVEFDNTVAERFQLDNFHSYWEYLLARHILLGNQPGGINGQSPSVILAQIPSPSRRLLWRSMLILPAAVSQRIFQLWWGSASWKQFTRPAARRLGLR